MSFIRFNPEQGRTTDRICFASEPEQTTARGNAGHKQPDVQSSATPRQSTSQSQASAPPSLIERPAELYLWDKDDGHFLKQEDVIASIVKRPSGTFDYWISARTQDGQQLLAHKLHSDLNVRWSSKLASLTWNHTSSDGLISSWCFKFSNDEDYKAFQSAYAQFAYESLNSVSWTKAKVRSDRILLDQN